MDQHKFVAIIRQFPQIWERSHPKFRDKDAKDCAWEVVGSKMGCTGKTKRFLLLITLILPKLYL